MTRLSRAFMRSSQNPKVTGRVTDQKSRNGTYLNGQKIDNGILTHGKVIRIGSLEMTFEISTNRLL